MYVEIKVSELRRKLRSLYIVFRHTSIENNMIFVLFAGFSFSLCPYLISGGTCEETCQYEARHQWGIPLCAEQGLKCCIPIGKGSHLFECYDKKCHKYFLCGNGSVKFSAVIKIEFLSVIESIQVHENFFQLWTIKYNFSSLSVIIVAMIAELKIKCTFYYSFIRVSSGKHFVLKDNTR